MKRFLLFFTAAAMSLLQAAAADFGIISVSVTDMKARASYTSETVSQAMMGTPVEITDCDGIWCRAVTPDGYTGWFLKENIRFFSGNGFEEWKKADRAIVTSYFEIVRESASENAPVVCDCIMGNIVTFHPDTSDVNGFRRIVLPSGETGFIRSASVCGLRTWLETRQARPSDITGTALLFTGFPYLWGGLSPKGMDCSGLNRLAYYMNGVILPRDAKDQILAGEKVDFRDPSCLQPADLIFFGRPDKEGNPESITHTGIYLGNGYFIHSYMHVRINRITPGYPDSFSRPALVGACRILGEQDKGKGAVSVLHHPWYFQTYK